MPTYLYETVPTALDESIERFELKQSFSEAPLTVHPQTGAPVRRVISGGIGLMTKSENSLPEPGPDAGRELRLRAIQLTPHQHADASNQQPARSSGRRPSPRTAAPGRAGNTCTSTTPRPSTASRAGSGPRPRAAPRLTPAPTPGRSSPNAPYATGSTVSAISRIVYQNIWSIVSRSPQTIGAIGTPARP